MKWKALLGLALGCGSAGCGGTNDVPGTTACSGAGGSAGVDLFAWPLPDGGRLTECVSCVRSECATSINTCANDEMCRRGLACVLASCGEVALQDYVGGEAIGRSESSTSSLSCVTACFEGNAGGMIELVSSVACVRDSCSASCSGTLDGSTGR
jgi:hypothetical protein